MKALLKLITTEDRAREILAICTRKGHALLHKNHQEPLTDAIISEGGFTVNFGGYGSYSRLGLGNTFGSKWEIEGLDVPASKGFTAVDVCFGVGLDPTKQQAITDYVAKQGGSVVQDGEGNCDLCILPSSQSEETNLLELMGQMVDGSKGFLSVDVDEFLSVYPAIKKPKAKAVPSSQLSEELKKLQKQLQERDHGSIQAALTALEGRDADIDLLIQGVSVDSATGELDRGPKFKGSGPAMEYLDLALSGLLSRAGEGSAAAQIRRSIKKLRFAIKVLPQLQGFSGLEELEIILNRIDEEEQTVIVKGLHTFGALPKLIRLKIENEPGYDSKSLRIKSLDGLEAPHLQQLEAPNIGLENIKALQGCTQLKLLDISENSDLSDISPLSGCRAIETLRINDTGVTSLDALAHASALAELNLNDCRALKSLKGIDTARISVFELRDLDLSTLDGLESLTALTRLDLAGMHKLTDLKALSKLSSLEEIELYNMTSIKSLPEFDKLVQLTSITIGSCDALEDVSSLAALKSLQKTSIRECRQLRSGPSQWPNTLVELSLEHTQLSELGICPAALTELSITNNPSLKSLDGIEGCEGLDVSSWGLDLSGCYKLESLDGLSISKLEAISIPETIGNLDALKRYPGIAITVVAGKGDKTGYRTVVKDIPPALGDALAKLSPTHLIVKTDWGAELLKITGIGRVTTLTSLDLSGCDLVDITAIAGLDQLELLKVQPRTELSKSLGKATFDSKGQIDKLRLKLLAGL
jgi:hypothetical protein